MDTNYSSNLYGITNTSEYPMINLFEKAKTIKLSDYFQIKNPEYVYLKLTPHSSNRNYNSSNIAVAINNIRRGIERRIGKIEKTWIYETVEKCSFAIEIQKEEVSFYFIVPKLHLSMAKEKIRGVWPRAIIEEVEPLKSFSKEAIRYYLGYKKEDALSLDVDKKSNEPLNYVLNVIDIMKEGDRVGIFYNFMPSAQFSWKAEYNKTMAKIKSSQPIEKEKFSASYILKMAVSAAIEVIDFSLDFLADFGLMEKKKKAHRDLGILELAISTINADKELSPATKKKKDASILDAQIVVLSDSEDTGRARQSAISVCQSYKSIDGDNELIYKPINKKAKTDLERYRFDVPVNKVSALECQNFIQLPGRELMDQFGIIKKIDVLETPVPKQLSKGGVVRAGTNSYLGGETEVYQTEDTELKNTAICICGPNRCGKTTLFANMTYDLVKDGRIVIVPDFCGKGKLGQDLAKVIGKDKTVNIDCADINSLQGFGWNEIVPMNDSPFERYRAAKDKTSRLKELINLVNTSENDVHGRMERFLEQAALITFSCGGSVNDVFKMLKDHKLRHRFIKSIPLELKNKLGEYVTELCEIDDIATKGDEKGEIVGTKISMVSAILSRVNRLKENAYVEEMLDRSCDKNINLLDLMKNKGEGGKLITITMPDSMFKTQQQKDTYVCYWLTKVWGALQQRYCEEQDETKMKQVVMLIDELYQTKNAESYLTSILSQVPKYKAKFIVSCHHLAQIPVIQEELKSAMCSYMFIRGSNKKNFYAMKEELEDKGFTLDDLLHLKRYQSLNLLAYEDGYWGGITKLPKPVEENIGISKI